MSKIIIEKANICENFRFHLFVQPYNYASTPVLTHLGYKIIFLSRLMPLPFGLANFAFAITRVDFFTYLTSSMIGLLPSQIILCYVGSTLKSMSDVIVNASTAKTAWLVFIVQLIIACFVMLWILNMAKLELNKQISINEIDKAESGTHNGNGSKIDSSDLKSTKLLLEV